MENYQRKRKRKHTSSEYEISINSDKLTLKLDQKLVFDNNIKDNILEESKLKDKSPNNFQVIKKAYQNIKAFYDFELKIESNIKTAKPPKINGEGYLIEKEWIDRWKEQIDYDKIKVDFLVSDKKEKEIRDELIYIFEKKKLKYIDLIDIKNKDLNEKKKIEEFLKKNSLVLVSSEFILSFKENTPLNKINYILGNNIKLISSLFFL